MRIASVEATPFVLQRTQPFRARTIGGSLSRHVLIQIRTEDGLEGIAEALAKPEIYGETQESIVAVYRQRIAKALIGLDVCDLDEAGERLAAIPANNSARAAADIALHDLWGKAMGAPLYRLFGGVRTEQTVSWTVGIAEPGAMADEAERIHRDHGINAFKIKGGEVPDNDVAAVRQIRERLPEAHLSLDANEGYTRHSAIRTLDQLADCDLAYVEEPIPHEDDGGRLEVARRIPMPILGDDSCFTLADVVRQVELGAIGLVSIKTPRTGFRESAKILAVAEAHGLRCIVGTAVGGALSSVAALQFSCARRSLSSPSENSFGINIDEDLVIGGPTVVAGKLTVPDGPGLGVTVSQERLAELSRVATRS